MSALKGVISAKNSNYNFANIESVRRKSEKKFKEGVFPKAAYTLMQRDDAPCTVTVTERSQEIAAEILMSFV